MADDSLDFVFDDEEWDEIFDSDSFELKAKDIQMDILSSLPQPTPPLASSSSSSTSPSSGVSAQIEEFEARDHLLRERLKELKDRFLELDQSTEANSWRFSAKV